MALDADREVAGAASQPFRFRWGDGRHHVPDYFVRTVDGSAQVVDVRCNDQISEADAELVRRSAVACRSVGWGYRRADPPLVGPQRRHRHRVSACPDVDAYIAAYPEIITLARILAHARCQIWITTAATPARAKVIEAVYTRTAHWFPEDRDRNRPVEQWIHDRALIAARSAVG